MASGFTDAEGEVTQRIPLVFKGQVRVADLSDHYVTKCGECKGLVLAEDMADHQSWHDREQLNSNPE